MAITSVPSATSSTTLLAPEYREGLIITNTDANRLYVRLDSGTASDTSYSFYLESGESFSVEGYVGEVVGIWSGDGSGAALLTTWG